MFNYRDLPEVDWDGMRSADILAGHIRNGDAVILSLPETSQVHVDPQACDCQVDPDGELVYDCDAAKALRAIADKNHLNGFEPVINTAAATRAKVDIDTGQRRIVIHR